MNTISKYYQMSHFSLYISSKSILFFFHNALNSEFCFSRDSVTEPAVSYASPTRRRNSFFGALCC